MIKFFRIFFIFLVLSLGIFAFFNPAKTQTNILRAIFPENQNSEMIINLSSKFSSKINVLIEAKTPQECERLGAEFLSEIDEEFFNVKKVDYIESFKFYEKYNKSFLSENTRNLLLKEDYETVKQQAFERLINPISISILPIEQDPFLLFTDYIMTLSNGTSTPINNTIQYGDKYYKYMVLETSSDSLSPTVMNEKVSKLTKLSERYNKIYLTGVPIHSYYASSKSIVEINAICILSTLFLFGLFIFFFRNLKLLIPALTSISLGMLCGYSIVSLLFDKVHILTFVFSTTLIGICVDYSLHYFVEKDLNKIMKSLTVSLISTSCAFLVLTFSGLELLKQISVFTITGLVSVYLFIILFYPIICKKLFKDYQRKIEINIKYKKTIIVVVLCVVLFGLFNLKFNDDIKNMYVPSKKMIEAEKLFSEVTNSNFKTSFVVVEGKDIQDILQKEETLASQFENYQAISKYVPSKKRQLENQQLRKNLYKNSLNDYAQFLTKEQRETLQNEANSELIEYDNSSILSELMLSNNKSLMVLYDAKTPDLKGLDGVEYIDLQKNISNKIKDYRTRCLSLLLPIVLALFVVLSVVYKNLLKAIRIILPSFLAACFAISVVGLFLKEINMFHILSIFLIIGFGLDYSVFRASGVKNSTLAVSLSCATSVFSFALLACTSFKLISSLGIILSVGLLTSYILSLFLIPSSGLEENKESI